MSYKTSRTKTSRARYNASQPLINLRPSNVNHQKPRPYIKKKSRKMSYQKKNNNKKIF